MTIAHQSPIVDSIIFNIIREFHFEKFRYSSREVIDTTLVPALSESLLKNKGFQESFFRPINLPPVTLPVFGRNNNNEKKEVKSKPVKKIGDAKIPAGYQESIMESEKTTRAEYPSGSKTVPKNADPIRSTTGVLNQPRPPINRPILPVAINLFQNPPNYGKLNQVIRDSSVQFIECMGPTIPLIVTKRNGLKQKTNITLLKEEITMLLNNVSAKTKIPLVTGVFRVSWDNLIINAIVSDTLEPRFILKKF